MVGPVARAKWVSACFPEGAFTAAQGGRFQDGFTGSFVSKLGLTLAFESGTFGDALGSPRDGSLKVIPRTITAALIGGTASKLGGGKFASGAASAAVSWMFNSEGGGRGLREAIFYDAMDDDSQNFAAAAKITAAAGRDSIAIPVDSYEKALEILELEVQANGQFDRVVFLDHGNRTYGPVFDYGLENFASDVNLAARLGACMVGHGRIWLYGCGGADSLAQILANNSGRTVISANNCNVLFRGGYEKAFRSTGSAVQGYKVAVGADLFAPSSFNKEHWRRYAPQN